MNRTTIDLDKAPSRRPQTSRWAIEVVASMDAKYNAETFMENGWIRVARLSDLREGKGYDTGEEVDGDFVGLFLIDGQIHAFGECTHERGPICQGHREGTVVTCPWHSARFDVTTGECVQGPVACRTSGSVLSGGTELEETEKVPALRCFEVKVEEEHVMVRPTSP